MSRASSLPVAPPSNVPLQAQDMSFFASVIDEFARSEWSPHQLELAAMLARKMSDMEREQREFRQEGSVITTPKGHEMPNPRLAVIRMLDTSIMATRRSLSLHARAKGGDARDIGGRRQKAKEIEQNNPFDDDDLLARPN